MRSADVCTPGEEEQKQEGEDLNALLALMVYAHSSRRLHQSVGALSLGQTRTSDKV